MYTVNYTTISSVTWVILAALFKEYGIENAVQIVGPFKDELFLLHAFERASKRRFNLCRPPKKNN